MPLRVRLFAATIAVLAPPVCAQGRAEVPVASRPASVRPRSPLRVPEDDRSVFLAPAATILSRPVAACP